MIAVCLRMVAGGERWCEVEWSKICYFETKSRDLVNREKALSQTHMGVFDRGASGVLPGGATGKK